MPVCTCGCVCACATCARVHVCVPRFQQSLKFLISSPIISVARTRTFPLRYCLHLSLCPRGSADRSHLLSRPFLVAYQAGSHIRALVLVVPSVAANLFLCFMISAFSSLRYQPRYHLSEESSDHPAQSSPKSSPIISPSAIYFISVSSI